MPRFYSVNFKALPFSNYGARDSVKRDLLCRGMRSAMYVYRTGKLGEGYCNLHVEKKALPKNYLGRSELEKKSRK